MSTTNKLNLKFISQHQLAKEIVVNENIKKIDNITAINAIDIIAEKPHAPQDGDLYVISDSPKHEWKNFANHFAFFNDDAWNIWPIANKTSFFVIYKRLWYTMINKKIVSHDNVLNENIRPVKILNGDVFLCLDTTCDASVIRSDNNVEAWLNIINSNFSFFNNNKANQPTWDNHAFGKNIPGVKFNYQILSTADLVPELNCFTIVAILKQNAKHDNIGTIFQASDSRFNIASKNVGYNQYQVSFHGQSKMSFCMPHKNKKFALVITVDRSGAGKIKCYINGICMQRSYNSQQLTLSNQLTLGAQNANFHNDFTIGYFAIHDHCMHDGEIVTISKNLMNKFDISHSNDVDMINDYFLMHSFDASNITTKDGLIKIWKDSVQDLHLTQYIPSCRPYYSDKGFGYNDLPSASFDGSNRFLQSANKILAMDRPITIIATMRIDQYLQNNHSLLSFSSEIELFKDSVRNNDAKHGISSYAGYEPHKDSDFVIPIQKIITSRCNLTSYKDDYKVIYGYEKYNRSAYQYSGFRNISGYCTLGKHWADYAVGSVKMSVNKINIYNMDVPENVYHKIVDVEHARCEQ